MGTGRNAACRSAIRVAHMADSCHMDVLASSVRHFVWRTRAGFHGHTECRSSAAKGQWVRCRRRRSSQYRATRPPATVMYFSRSSMNSRC